MTRDFHRFNPIAPTLLKKALQAMLKTHFSSSCSVPSIAPSKEVLDIIVESAHGDIRSAIMALQFACIMELPGQKKKGQLGSTIVLEAVTRREQSLALFHLLGKVMYNKRTSINHSTNSDQMEVYLLTNTPNRQRRSSEFLCDCQGSTEGTRD